MLMIAGGGAFERQLQVWSRSAEVIYDSITTTRQYCQKSQS